MFPEYQCDRGGFPYEMISAWRSPVGKGKKSIVCNGDLAAAQNLLENVHVKRLVLMNSNISNT